MFIKEQKLYMILLGCKPKDRHTEQHDIFFGIAPSLKQLVPECINFWPQGQSNLHIDAWRSIQIVDGYKISIVPQSNNKLYDLSLFFINLGGYEKGNFDELHFKLLVVAKNAAAAIKKAKLITFYKTAHFSGAPSHIDDHYEIDDLIDVKKVLASKNFDLHFEKLNEPIKGEDKIHLGYFNLEKLKDKW